MSHWNTVANSNVYFTFVFHFLTTIAIFPFLTRNEAINLFEQKTNKCYDAHERVILVRKCQNGHNIQAVMRNQYKVKQKIYEAFGNKKRISVTSEWYQKLILETCERLGSKVREETALIKEEGTISQKQLMVKVHHKLFATISPIYN